MGVLTGIRVIDLSIIVQGPQAAQVLADMGADVVKVELPNVGDLARWLPITVEDRRAPYFIACNRGKRCATLDLRTEGGRTALLKMAESADIVVSNFKPGTLESWGLSYEEVAAVNPRIIYATGSAFGPDGPDAEREGADLAGQAAGGLISTTGTDSGEPTPNGAVIADHIASQNMVIGILGALLVRQSSGVGQRIDVSLLGGQIWAQASEYTAYLLSGTVPGRSNRGHPLLKSVYRIFPTADGWIAMVGIPAFLWPGFCRAIERPDLADDPRFNVLLPAEADLKVLFPILDGIFAARTTAEWSDRLVAEQQRFAAVYDYAQVAAWEQSVVNGYLVDIDHPQWGHQRMVGTPIRMSATPLEPSYDVYDLGQHTEEVLLEAGFTWDEIADLRARGAY